MQALTEKVVFHSHQPLSRLVATSEPDVAEVNVNESANEPRTWEITVTPRLDLRPGSLDAKLVITGYDVKDKELPSLHVPIQGEVFPDIHVLGDRVVLGAHAVGSTVKEQVVLRSHSGSEFLIENVLPDTESVEVAEVPEGFADSHAIRLSTRIESVGNRSILLLVRVKRRDSEPRILKINMSYYGYELNNRRPQP